MGLGFGGSSSSYDKPTVVYCNCNQQQSPETCQVQTQGRRKAKKKFPNPNPKNFEILYSEQIGEFLIVRIKYPDCTNFEGVKILVYAEGTVADLLAQGSIDPHFSNNPDFYSPIARFVPTTGGMVMAKAFVKAMTEGNF
ncbi:MAG: hypothetical protein M0R80_02665 [Proteobacteria bacterium]|jgi:hypothetical protein|nr:hypothetical protein [Pseudomonadota bacterium]